MQRSKYKLVVILPWTESLTLQSSFFFFWVLNQTDNFPGQQHSAWQLANAGSQTWTGTQLQEPRLSRWNLKQSWFNSPTYHSQESLGDEYLENNCVDDPVKLCDFQLLENRIMKTVDSVYQVSNLFFFCLPVYIHVSVLLQIFSWQGPTTIAWLISTNYWQRGSYL